MSTRRVCVLLALAMSSVVSPAAAQDLPDLGADLGVDVPVDPGGVPPALPEGLEIETPGAGVVDHEAALKAVQDRRALPLDALLRGVARLTRGEVIDVQLVRSGRELLYEVKLLDRGRVSLAYFHAATGAPAPPPR